MAEQRNTTKRFFLFAGLFLIPAFLIYFFALAKQVFIDLPYYGPSTMVDGKEVHYKVPPFQFTDHLGNSVTNETLKGKVIILNTVVNTCPEECPIALGQFYQFAYLRIAHSAEMGEVVIISHVVDVGENKGNPLLVITDLPKGADVNFDKWKFVTGDYNSLYDMDIDRGDSLGVKNPYREMRNDVVGERASNSLMLLIDHEGYVRGYFPGAVNAGITEIEKQAALLCIAKRHKNVQQK